MINKKTPRGLRPMNKEYDGGPVSVRAPGDPPLQAP